MKNNTIYLEAILEDTCLKTGCHTNESVWTYETKKVPIDFIESRCNQIIEILNNAQRKKIEKHINILNHIKNIGRILADELLTPAIKARINETSSQNMIIRIDDNLVHILWELLCINDELLCQKFNLGREVRTKQNTSHYKETSINSPLKMWIISDPYDQLSMTIQEGRNICNYMDRLNNKEIIVDTLHQSQIMPYEINEKIRDFDIVHFAGHMEYNEKKPDENGWHLSNGIFQAKDILKLKDSGSLPSFVFSNACQSAKTSAWNNSSTPSNHLQHSYGLANAFMISGVKHYIGTICEIIDTSGSQFASFFYESLVKGESIGKSVRIARQKLLKNNPDDIGWATYLLYGDPDTNYFQKTENSEQNKSIKNVYNTYSEKKENNYDLRSRWSGPSSKKISFSDNMIIVLLLIIIITFQIVMSNKKIPAEIITIIEKCADTKQNKIEKLFDSYIKIVGEDKDDGWTSGNLSLYVEAGKSQNKYDDMIALVIEKMILNSSLKIDLLEREPFSFDQILTEKVRILKQGGKKVKLKMPKLALIVTSHHYKQRSFWFVEKEKLAVALRIVDIDKSLILKLFHESYEKNESFLDSKKFRFNELISTFKELKKEYPIRGKITNISKNEAIMNIGEWHGVKIGQKYKSSIEDIYFVVTSIKAQSCKIEPLKPDSNIFVGMKLECVELGNWWNWVWNWVGPS